MKDTPSRKGMGWTGGKAKAVLLIGLLLLLAVPVEAQANQPQQLIEGATVINLAQGDVHEIQFNVESTTTALLSWSCSSCDVEVSEMDAELTVETHGGSMLSVQATQTGGLTMTVTADSSDRLELLLLHDITAPESTQRPAPGDDTEFTEPKQCTQIETCLTATDQHLFAVPTTNDHGTVRGILEANTFHHLAFNASSGDTLEWQWMATTQPVIVEMYHQTDMNELLMNETLISQAASGWPTSAPTGLHWTAPADGRFIARLSTESPTSIWAAHVVHHPQLTIQSMMEVNLSEGVNIVGHEGISAPFSWDDVHELTVEAVHREVNFSVDQLLNGAWVSGSLRTLTPGEPVSIYPYPDVTAGRLKITDSPAFMVKVLTRSFTDAGGYEAPSYRPVDNRTDNSTWPVINLTDETTGELTLSVHDTTDTYRLVVDGWSESIHFVQFVFEGDATGLELQLWDIDQNTGEVLATDITRPVGDQLRIGLQVGRGTHYLQLRFQNASDATPHLWGEEVPSRAYTLRPAYTLIDEGDEPWFPPSEEAVFWGGVARWFMGLLFLLPVLYLVVHVKRSQAFAASVAAKKARLSWYIERLDSGESSAKQARMDMSKALRAVSELEWAEGLEAWGPKRLEHRTEDMALAVWSVDQRLATTDEGWPVVVGVHVLNGTWDLAALRFDAPDGQGFEVGHVEPRFLFQGEEVFLDTMGPGHRTYLVVELVGSAQRVDVELNGRMDGQPFAARIPETLER